MVADPVHRDPPDPPGGIFVRRDLIPSRYEPDEGFLDGVGRRFSLPGHDGERSDQTRVFTLEDVLGARVPGARTIGAYDIAHRPIVQAGYPPVGRERRVFRMHHRDSPIVADSG